MSTVTHGTFVIERVYPASPARVFAAWARPETKLRWFACHDDWKPLEHHLDLRAGGTETLSTGTPAGSVHRMDARYLDVVPDRRFVYAYEMHVDQTRISVSLATVDLVPEGRGTRMIFTEQVAFLDGHADLAGREEGTRVGLDQLARVLGAD